VNIQFIKKNISIPVMVVMAGMFFSCVNDLDKVKLVTTNPDGPNDTSEDLHIVYTDSGIAQVEIFATIAETYTTPKAITKFKDGLKVNFFNKDGTIASTLTSIYGEVEQASGNITVRDSVRLHNIEQEKTLETEVLYWEQSKDSIYTDREVVIKSPDMILNGIGAWTTPKFDTAQFYKPTAKIFIKDK
jgi:LPS export ABC transporter protein LptC